MYSGEDRRSGDSMERMVGQLQGQIEGIKSSLDRIERDLDHNTRATEKLADEMDGLSLTVSTLKTEAKIGWKLLTGIAAATSVGGASVKHLLEKLLG